MLKKLILGLSLAAGIVAPAAALNTTYGQAGKPACADCCKPGKCADCCKGKCADCCKGGKCSQCSKGDKCADCAKHKDGSGCKGKDCGGGKCPKPQPGDLFP